MGIGKNSYRYLLFIMLLGMAVFSLHRVTSLYELPYPHFNRLATGQKGLQDIGGIIMGFRTAAADIAWVQLIQYCGEDTMTAQEETSRTFDSLKNLTFRVVRMDPYFYEAYLFGSGMLAWFKNVNRPDEAVEILQEGIRNNPKYWPFRIYLGAIVFKKSKEYGKMASLLEDAVKYPDSPPLIRAILANYYKSQGEYEKAIAVWKPLLSGENPEYRTRAADQTAAIEGLVKANKKKGK